MKKKNFKKLFAVLIAVCMMVIGFPVTSQAAVRVSAPRLKSAKSASSGIQLTWSKVSNASGYVIYRNDKCIGGVKGNKTVSYIDRKAKTGSRYTYLVRAFRQYGKNVFTAVPATGFRESEKPSAIMVLELRFRPVSVSGKISVPMVQMA